MYGNVNFIEKKIWFLFKIYMYLNVIFDIIICFIKGI